MQLIDTHTHLDFPDFDSDRDALLQACTEAGITQMVVLGTRSADWPRLWGLVQQHDDLVGALGLHPIYLAEHRPEHLAQLKQWLEHLAGHPKLCALGEFGLDYWLDLDRAAQQALFEAQLKLACDYALPALLHIRHAHDATLATLKRFKPVRGGIIHAFAGSFEQAQQYHKLGFKLGLGGAVTWPQAQRLRKVVAKLPSEWLVLETDSPDMAPAMFAGLRNSPLHLPAICQALAAVRGESPESLAQASTANAKALLAL